MGTADASALAAAFAAFALTLVGARRRDGRVVLVGTAFTVMAALLAIHGLATPGIIIGANGVISLTGAATLPVGGAVLALSALPGLRRPHGIRALLAFQALAAVLVVGLGVIGMAFPSVVPPVPEPATRPAFIALALGVFFYAVLVLRALKTYLLTRRTADLVVVVGVAWLTAALPPALLFTYDHLGWWLGHGFELVGIVIVGASSAHGCESSLRGSHRKDKSTEEHTRRVALRAVQVGEELGLSPGRLRALAIGGLLHDIGKLSVPERILKKPGALEDEEFAVVKRHPDWGLKLLRELGGFSAGVQAAIALLRQETGSAFDERCVSDLEAVLRRAEPQPVMPMLRVAAASA